MKTFKAALFDLDGTLVDTEKQYTVFWGATARKYRPDIPQLEYIIKGTTLTQIYDRYFPDPQWQAEITEALNAYERDMSYDFFPGALEFINDIRRHGVKCAIVTSSNQEKLKAVRAKVENFDTLFDRVLTSEDFAASKPDPDCYLKGAAAFGLSTDECVVFEDAFTGLQAGMSSGIYTIGLATENSAESISDKCHHVLPDFTGIDYEYIARIINTCES